MSISDKLMWRYIELLSFRSLKDIQQWRADVASGTNPIDIKKTFAQEIVTRFHNEEAGQQAREGFNNQFKKGQIPDDIADITLSSPENGLPIANVLKDAGLTNSTSEAHRMIKQGAVKLDGHKIDDRHLIITAGNSHIIQVGKRKFANVSIV